MKRIELVFRSVGERTAEAALELAVRHIAPQRIHRLEQVRPFWKTVQQMLTLPIAADVVVFVDADCLIMEDMRPFLERNDEPYVDCYVLDRFRGRLHAGVHITRMDVLEGMRQVSVRGDEMKYILRPESYLRHLALERAGLGKAVAPFCIFHDFGQWYADIFAKYALRELRSRTPEQRIKLDRIMGQWPTDDLDFAVARHAVAHTRRAMPPDGSPQQVAAYIAELPQVATREMAILGLTEKEALTHAELDTMHRAHGAGLAARREKVFGVGLSRTGTKSLTSALDILGYTVAHYPTDEITFHELVTGQYRLSTLGACGFDGLTDIIGAGFYAQLDSAFPGSKFILTLRDKEAWLDAMERHWHEKPVYSEQPEETAKLKMRRFLRAAVYGTYTFSRERLAYVYDRHHEAVLHYFRHRPDDLLLLNLFEGEGWDKLCPFLGCGPLDHPFPRVASKRTLQEMVGGSRLAPELPALVG